MLLHGEEEKFRPADLCAVVAIRTGVVFHQILLTDSPSTYAIQLNQSLDLAGESHAAFKMKPGHQLPIAF
ncbi:hypothetical protein T265_01185 [Opisthorchis viverrini]|uniref:Uncharacterized protein n=1 Tax=Opisthorchis viverrini TaxID=6198 RepID=A0A074ZZL6_OPIVI|nr:hypothetical protein T265_01185 [Opisthorchis viverrini]KER32908.1 hypothetical protein T265_01185 [Opisthorchis viverrini]